MCTKYEVSMSNHVPRGGVHRRQCRCRCRMMPMMMTDKASLYKALRLINQMSQKAVGLLLVTVILPEYFHKENM